MQVEKLKTIDADTLLITPLHKTLFVVEGLIPQGFSVRPGSSKIGKSRLMLWLGIRLQEEITYGSLRLTSVMCCISAWKIPTPAFKAGCIH